MAPVGEVWIACGKGEFAELVSGFGEGVLHDALDLVVVGWPVVVPVVGGADGSLGCS